MVWCCASSLSLLLTACLIGRLKDFRESVCDPPDLSTDEAKIHLKFITCLTEEARTSAPAKLFADCIYLL